jgi:hypothetical protein
MVMVRSEGDNANGNINAKGNGNEENSGKRKNSRKYTAVHASRT